MSGDQALIAVLIALCSFGLALGLMAGLWIFGLNVLDRYSRRYVSFELIVALGHLRGHKSGYLKIMTLVVLLAMTMANWTLPIVLSVMGGFGNDLKEKILDATAHILVDSARPDLSLPNPTRSSDLDDLAKQLKTFPYTKVVLSSGTKRDAQKVADELERRGIEVSRLDVQVRQRTSRPGVRVEPSGDERALRDFQELAARIQAIEGVTGVTPFIDADVMLASQTNIAAVVLKGVDTTTMDKVIGLRDTMEQGDLIYLDQPEKLLPDVMAEQERRMHLFLEEAGLGPDGDGGPDAGRSGIGLGPPISIRPDADGPAASKTKTKSKSQSSSSGSSTQERILPAVVVGRELAKTLRVFVGDEVNVVSPLGGMGPLGPIPKARPYRVAGVFFSGMYQDDAKNAYVSLDVTQRFLGIEDTISGLRIRVGDIEDAGAIAAQMEDDLGSRYRIRSWEVVNANLFSALRLEKIAMFALYSVFFIICAFLIASTLTMMVLEKRRGIAVLKTLGASNLRLGMIFMFQGMVAGIVGTISGQIAAFFGCLGLGTFVKIQPEVYYIDSLPVTMEPLEFISVAGLALLTAAAATVLPLAATSLLRPVDGLRQ